MPQFQFYDLRRRMGSPHIEMLFPAWQAERERVMVFSPHDDDALLGAGYAIAACQAQGVDVHIAIFCDGSAGYSRPEDRHTIVKTRRVEAQAAYARLGVSAERLHWLAYPDFSLRDYMGWRLSGGQRGTLEPVVRLLRSIGVTRLLIPNGYREHTDHEATYDIGRYDGVQAGDPVVADWGEPSAIQSVLQYAVWGDLSPEDALEHGGDLRIRANRAILADYAVEQNLAEALACFASQGAIIAGLLEQRRRRDCGWGMLEVYLTLDPRPALDYAPYVRLIRSLTI
jgi:LmbE family N-acetylglucosaminyl deacetylase